MRPAHTAHVGAIKNRTSFLGEKAQTIFLSEEVCTASLLGEKDKEILLSEEVWRNLRRDCILCLQQVRCASVFAPRRVTFPEPLKLAEVAAPMGVSSSLAPLTPGSASVAMSSPRSQAGSIPVGPALSEGVKVVEKVKDVPSGGGRWAGL